MVIAWNIVDMNGIILAGWWFGTFFHILGRIIPTDFHIFQRGRYTTNQLGYDWNIGLSMKKLWFHGIRMGFLRF